MWRLTKADFSREILAGLTTFFTMSYIIIVNPQVMSSEGTGISLAGSLTATVLISAMMSLIAGIVIRLPYALAPGMGLNAFIAYSLIIGEKIPWPTALGIVFWSSLLFLLISIFPIRQKIVEALPDNMKHAMSCGIGLFLAFIGLKNLGIVVANPATYVGMGAVDFKVVSGLIGFFIAFYFFQKGKPYAFLLSIVFVTLMSLFAGVVHMPSSIFSMPDFSSQFFKLDLVGALKWSYVPAILAVLLTNLFDSISSLIGLATSAGFIDEKGNPLRLKQTLLVDSFASFFATLFGTAPATVFIESSAGIHAGGRTGLVSFVVAICFIPCLFLAPLIGMIPIYATAPILVFVGILMIRTLQHIKADSLEEIIPIFITIFLMPITFSITQGVLWGIVSYVLFKLFAGKWRMISPALWILSSVCVGAIALK